MFQQFLSVDVSSNTCADGSATNRNGSNGST